MTFNIRLDTPADGDNAWPYRKEMAASMVRFHRADVAGLQEVLHHQVTQLDSLLQDYARIGTGRDDGARNGEYSPIFYNKEKLECLQNGQFWLSENPGTPGIGWDAACPRIVTWGKFRNRHNRKTFYHFNTHFDHVGQTARRESARLIKRKIQEIAGDAPVVSYRRFQFPPFLGALPDPDRSGRRHASERRISGQSGTPARTRRYLERVSYGRETRAKD